MRINPDQNFDHLRFEIDNVEEPDVPLYGREIRVAEANDNPHKFAKGFGKAGLNSIVDVAAFKPGRHAANPSEVTPYVTPYPEKPKGRHKADS